MKVTATIGMGFLLIGCGPLLADTPASSASNGEPVSLVVTQPVLPAYSKVAQQAETTTSTTPSTDQSGSEQKKPEQKKQVQKKKTSQNHGQAQPRARSGAAVYKEGGKTCSGLDDYKVCW